MLYYITPVDLDGETFYAIVDAADVRFGTLYPNMLAADTAAVLHFQPATIGGARCPSCGDLSAGVCPACREWESDPPGGPPPPGDDIPGPGDPIPPPYHG